MKIAVIDTIIDDKLIGGAQTFLPKLLKGLIDQGNEVHFITKGTPNKKILRQIENSKAVRHSGIWDAGGFVEETAPVLADWLNNLMPDVFLISSSSDIGWVVLPLLDPKIATVAIAHSDQNTFYVPIEHYAGFLTCAVGVSLDICHKFETVCSLKKSQISWIPYGVEIRESPIEENTEPIRLIYVGRLEHEDKRSGDVIRIIKKLEEENIDYRFKVIGDGALKPEFTTELEKEIKSVAVVLLGWVEGSEVLLHLRQSDIFVLTSDSEGFCIAMIEAAGNGCCLLVTDIPGGNQQLVKNGENGFLIPVGDIGGFVDQINSLSDNRNVLFNLRKNSFEAGKKFSVQKMVDSYYQCFVRSMEAAEKSRRQLDLGFPLMKTCRSKYPLWLRKIKAKTKQLISAG
jgi:glycosyltransferase involved in cell wall biosynthesis